MTPKFNANGPLVVFVGPPGGGKTSATLACVKTMRSNKENMLRGLSESLDRQYRIATAGRPTIRTRGSADTLPEGKSSAVEQTAIHTQQSPFTLEAWAGEDGYTNNAIELPELLRRLEERQVKLLVLTANPFAHSAGLAAWALAEIIYKFQQITAFTFGEAADLAAWLIWRTKSPLTAYLDKDDDDRDESGKAETPVDGIEIDTTVVAEPTATRSGLAAAFPEWGLLGDKILRQARIARNDNVRFGRDEFKQAFSVTGVTDDEAQWLLTTIERIAKQKTGYDVGWGQLVDLARVFPDSLVCLSHADLLTYCPTIERNALVQFGQSIFPDPENVNQNQIVIHGSSKPVIRNLRPAPIYLDGPSEKADELLKAIRRQLARIERRPPVAPFVDASPSHIVSETESPLAPMTEPQAEIAPALAPSAPRPWSGDLRLTVGLGIVLTALLPALFICAIADANKGTVVELFAVFLFLATAAFGVWWAWRNKTAIRAGIAAATKPPAGPTAAPPAIPQSLASRAVSIDALVKSNHRPTTI